MKLFLDSGAFIARAVTNDKYHDAAMATFKAISRRELPYQIGRAHV